MTREYITPTGDIYTLYENMLSNSHMLIAGATGSGKSVVINGMIATALYNSPAKVRFILIDVKRVELIEYRELPHTLQYADDVKSAVNALKTALAIIETRFVDMQRKKLRKYDGSDIYVIIDELADLMTTAKRDVTPLIQRICQIGRAARVHIIAATQCPIVEVIPTRIKVNFDAVLGLRTRSARDSYNILGFRGCEHLPRFGYGYYMRPESTDLYKLPMISDADRQRLIDYWQGPAGEGKAVQL